MFYVLFFRCKSSIDDLFPPNFLTSFLRITLHGTRTPRFYTRTVFHFNISKKGKFKFQSTISRKDTKMVTERSRSKTQRAQSFLY